MFLEEYRKLIMGEHSKRAAFNYIVQGAGANRAAIIGNTTFAKEMSFGGINEGFNHTLVCCEVIIRPAIVIGSDHLTGCGAAGILTSSEGLAFLDPWLAKGKIILDAR